MAENRYHLKIYHLKIGIQCSQSDYSLSFAFEVKVLKVFIKHVQKHQEHCCYNLLDVVIFWSLKQCVLIGPGYFIYI